MIHQLPANISLASYFRWNGGIIKRTAKISKTIMHYAKLRYANCLANFDTFAYCMAVLLQTCNWADTVIWSFYDNNNTAVGTLGIYRLWRHSSIATEMCPTNKSDALPLHFSTPLTCFRKIFNVKSKDVVHELWIWVRAVFSQWRYWHKEKYISREAWPLR